jgi:hypothetical protein
MVIEKGLAGSRGTTSSSQVNILKHELNIIKPLQVVNNTNFEKKQPPNNNQILSRMQSSSLEYLNTTDDEI